MPRTCNAVHDSRCEGACDTECYSCGQPVCKSCSIVVPYYQYRNKRIGVCCFRERFTNWKDLLNWLTYTHAGYAWGPMPEPRQDQGNEEILDEDAVRHLLGSLRISDAEIAKVAKVKIDDIRSQLNSILDFQPSVREAATKLIRSHILGQWRDDLKLIRQIMNASGTTTLDDLEKWLKDAPDVPIGTLVREFTTRR